MWAARGRQRHAPVPIQILMEAAQLARVEVGDDLADEANELAHHQHAVALLVHLKEHLRQPPPPLFPVLLQTPAPHITR